MQEIDGKALVFVHDGTDLRAARRWRWGPRREGLVEVRSGLREGERVAAAGSFLLKSELLKGSLAEE